MENGFFRSKSGYTVVQNAITKDKSVSLKAKGLYLVIQAYITMPDKKWRKDDFMDMSTDGKKAFGSAWDELKNKGFLKVHMFPNGNCWRVEYELLDEPKEGAHTFYYNKAGEVSRTNIDRANTREAKIAEDSEKHGSEDSDDEDWEEPLRIPPFGSNAKGSNAKGSNAKGNNAKGNNAKGSIAKGGNTNNSLSVNPFTNTKRNPSINPSRVGWGGDAGADGRMDESFVSVSLDLSKKLLDGDCFDMSCRIRECGGIDDNLIWDKDKITLMIQYLCQWNYWLGECQGLYLEAYGMVVEGIIDMLLCRDKMRISGQLVSAEMVLDQLNKCIKADSNQSLNVYAMMTTDRFYKALSEQEIKNPKSYVRTTIWNCFGTYLVDYDSKIEKIIHTR